MVKGALLPQAGTPNRVMKAAFFFIMEVPLTSEWRGLTVAAVVGPLF